ncbi:hypothetical protein FRC11_012769, partial [Ceratobasidium sp. 423]
MAGAVFGALALLGALGLGVCIALRRRRRRRVAPRIPERAKEVNFDAENVQPIQQYGRGYSTGPHHPEDAIILPFILPSNTSQQENARLNPPRKRPHETSGGTVDTSDLSQVYGTGTSTNQSTLGFRSDPDDEPMIIRHEDAGAIIPARTREVIELPPGYDQLPRPLPPIQAPQEARPQPMPSQKST